MKVEQPPSTMNEPGERTPEELLSVEMVPDIGSEVVNLSIATTTSPLKVSDRETVSDTSSDIMGSQYISIHRVADVDSLDKSLVDATSSALMSSEMIQHHVVHGGMVVDMMVPVSNGTAVSDFAQAHASHFISEHYDAEDLLSHGLTEEDRKLAAALVAVQLVQQQKHHQGSPEAPGLLSPSSKVHVPVSLAEHGQPVSAMVSSYIQAVEEEALLDQPLPPLKKALSSRSLSARSRYLRPHLLGKPDDGLQLPPPQVSSLSEQLREEYGIKCEGLDDDIIIEESDDGMQDDNDSDYDVENDLRSSRKSLPHKKRIPRKLKNMKKTSSPSHCSLAKLHKCSTCGDQFMSQAALRSHWLTHTSPKKMFSCELCGKGIVNQLKFFEHLKFHYEPATITKSTVDDRTSDPNKSGTSLLKEVLLSSSRNNLTITSGPMPSKPPEAVPETIGAIPPPLTCGQCGRTFRRQKALETHISVTHPKQEEIEEFSEPEDLMEGIRGVVEVDGDTGDEADMDCLGPSSLMRGLKSGVDKVWYREEDLRATEVDLQAMESSNQPGQPTSEEDHICDLCGDIYESRDHLTDHVREEHLELSPRRRSVQRHVLQCFPKRQNRAANRLKCTQCDRTFNHRNSLVYHLRSHSGERPHQCEVCGKSFFAASALKVHMRLHSGDKPYKCEFCGRHFRQWGDLKYHCISIHSEEKNYQCEYCGKDFARKYSLIVHRRIHTGEKNYKCEFCNKTFRASSYLQNHRRIHTGEKPHPCEVCGKPFRVRSDMKRHLNTHTRERPRGGASHDGEPPTKQEAPDEEAEPAEEDEEEQDAELAALEANEQSMQVLPEMQPVTEITIQTSSASGTVLSQDPINLNIAVPTRHQLSSEDVLHYTRDPLETVRDGTNTVYVWPIYMA
ncbi:zinc finger protein 37-like [Bacillus rossius redtenbacheri]|uniref:zinc finger protein 37-like n=1 Tax=Bacillus rossius redtenbacheri TaxID=93214 RepID=UPI002FDE20AD